MLSPTPFPSLKSITAAIRISSTLQCFSPSHCIHVTCVRQVLSISRLRNLNQWVTVTQDSDSGTDRSTQVTRPRPRLLKYQAVIAGEAAGCATLNSDWPRLGHRSTRRLGINDSTWRRTCPQESLDYKCVSNRSGRNRLE